MYFLILGEVKKSAGWPATADELVIKMVEQLENWKENQADCKAGGASII